MSTPLLSGSVSLYKDGFRPGQSYEGSQRGEPDALDVGAAEAAELEEPEVAEQEELQAGRQTDEVRSECLNG
jgi:hypothetical protein